MILGRRKKVGATASFVSSLDFWVGVWSIGHGMHAWHGRVLHCMDSA